jgi:lysine 2,3-aminomutase
MTKSSIHSLQALTKMGIQMTAEIEAVARQFSVAITPAMANLIDASDPFDPIAAQFVPSGKELSMRDDELKDPISDKLYSPVEGIVHRYPDRVLLKLLHSCPVYCRFCFRREQVGKTGDFLKPQALEKALSYIRSRKEIWEVILSGGDPFILSDRRLAKVIDALNAIDHVKVLRIHTRVPVVMPERVTSTLVDILAGKKPTYVLLHCNHARELTAEAKEACSRLIDRGIPMLSQSVLLKGINDDEGSMRDLMKAFVECRIKPHYVHHGDLARGTSHFRTTISKGQKLIQSLRGRLSGLCQPTYILDIPGGFGKVPLGPSYIKTTHQGYEVEDTKGARHNYCDSVEG